MIGICAGRQLVASHIATLTGATSQLLLALRNLNLVVTRRNFTEFTLLFQQSIRMKWFELSLALLLLLGATVFAEEEGEEEDDKESVGTVIGIDLGTTYSW